MKAIFRKSEFGPLEFIRRNLFFRKGLVLKPVFQDAVVSDLFLIRQDENWKTEFELIKINDLIRGDLLADNNYTFTIHFFDSNGDYLYSKKIEGSNSPRITLRIEKLIDSLFNAPSTFAIEHPKLVSNDILGEAHITDRGYTGYEFMRSGTKGYVHGNLDAIAIYEGNFFPMGNSGRFKRLYTIQHLLHGPAVYDFGLVNSTSRFQKIEIEELRNGGTWRKIKTLKLNSLGSALFRIDVLNGDKVLIRIRSKIYMSRPLVFRTYMSTMDVFHG